MDDQQKWAQAVELTTRHYEQLPIAIRGELDALIGKIMQTKEQLGELALSTGSAQICQTCGGKCCLNGKYHVSALDLLAFRICLAEPVVPDFNAHPDCPYSGESGCLMPPGHRPMTCIVFNCELIETRMAQDKCGVFYAYEKQLRELIRHACQITGRRLDRPLLLSC